MSTIASDVADPVSVVVRQPRAMRNAPSPTSDTVRADHSSLKSWLRKAYSARARPSRSVPGSTVRGYPRRLVASLRAVLLDVDFTLAMPGPELGPEAYRSLGDAHGLSLDTSRYPDARAAAVAGLERHPELDHDEEIWVRFTEDIVRGMGGDGPEVALVAREIVSRWEHAHHFELYDDVPSVLAELRAMGLKLALVSNTSRDLGAFVRHFALDVDAWVSSGSHGKVKPSPLIFAAALELLEVTAGEAVMVGDSLEDDVEGAQACGLRAILLDRNGRFPEHVGRIESLRELAAALAAS
jgi:HAD superfamily hydrolase (TIGR01662 family)